MCVLVIGRSFRDSVNSPDGTCEEEEEEEKKDSNACLDIVEGGNGLTANRNTGPTQPTHNRIKTKVPSEIVRT